LVPLSAGRLGDVGVISAVEEILSEFVGRKKTFNFDKVVVIQ